MSFGIALSGLNAAQQDLNVTANNIANSSTTGFKQSRAEFADMFAVSPYGVNRNATGNGVKVAAVSQQFTQGNINTTNNSMDLALSGQGFFVLERRRLDGVQPRRRVPAEQRRLCREQSGAALAGVSGL